MITPAMTDDTTDRIITEIDALEADDRGADSDEVGARSADDQFPWTDAARWSPGDLDEGCGYGEPDDELSCIPWDVPGRVIVLSAHLGDGRTARWSMLTPELGQFSAHRGCGCW